MTICITSSTLKSGALLRRSIFITVTALLTGCGGAVVMKEDAKAAAAAAKASTEASRQFYAKLANSRSAYLLDDVAADPNCVINWTIDLIPDPVNGNWRCVTAAEAAVLSACRTRPPGAACPSTGLPLPLERSLQFTFGAEEQSTALTLVDAIAEYQVLLTQIVSDPEVDTKADLENLLKRAKEIEGVFKGLGAKLPTIGGEVIDAASGFVDLVKKTAEDARDLKALRTLLQGPNSAGAKFEAALRTLSLRYRNLDRPLYDLFDDDRLQDQREAYNNLPRETTFDERRKMLGAFTAAKADLDLRRSSRDTLAESFDALATIHSQLRDAVVEGKYTESQRRRIAAANLRAFKAWFDAIRSIATLF